MPRVERTDIGEYVYHILNRANARVQIFNSGKDYQLFESILEEAVEKYDRQKMRKRQSRDQLLKVISLVVIVG